MGTIVSIRLATNCRGAHEIKLGKMNWEMNKKKSVGKETIEGIAMTELEIGIGVTS